MEEGIKFTKLRAYIQCRKFARLGEICLTATTSTGAQLMLVRELSVVTPAEHPKKTIEKQVGGIYQLVEGWHLHSSFHDGCRAISCGQ